MKALADDEVFSLHDLGRPTVVEQCLVLDFVLEQRNHLCIATPPKHRFYGRPIRMLSGT